MELKFRGVDGTFGVELDKDIRVKPFLTWSEFSGIYELVSAQDNSFMRYYCKIVEFAKTCTNIDFDGMEDVEIYDMVSELGLKYEFSIALEEFDELDMMIKKDESVYNAIKEISNGLGGFASITDKLKEAMENGSK